MPNLSLGLCLMSSEIAKAMKEEAYKFGELVMFING